MTEVLNGGNCVHHWVMGMPMEGVTRGECKKCGEEREWKPDPVTYGGTESAYGQGFRRNQFFPIGMVNNWNSGWSVREREYLD